MKLKSIVKTAVLGIVVSTLAACAAGIQVGSTPDAIPPQIVDDPENPANRIWDRPGAFGPVPATLQQAAAAVCAEMGTQFKAIGYHPQAKDYNGNEFNGGGYLCVEK